MTRNTPNDTLNRKPTLVKAGRVQTRLFKRLVALALRLGYFAAATVDVCTKIASSCRRKRMRRTCARWSRDAWHKQSLEHNVCQLCLKYFSPYIPAYIRKIVIYENISREFRFEKRGSANIHIQRCASSNTNTFLSEVVRKIDRHKECSSQDVVLITVLTQKVTCVLLFDTYENKIELSLRHYYKTHIPHGEILRSPVCVMWRVRPNFSKVNVKAEYFRDSKFFGYSTFRLSRNT